MILVQALIGMSILIFVGLCAILPLGTMALMTYFNRHTKTRRKSSLRMTDRLLNLGKAIGIALLLCVLFTILTMAFFSIFLHDPF